MDSYIKKLILQAGYIIAKLLVVINVVMASVEESNMISPANDSSSVLQLVSSLDNPRNSEGDFITLKDGRVLFVYSHYTGNSDSDHGTAFLAGRYSHDGGRTWSTGDRVIVEQEGKMNVMSVSLLRLQNGQIALFYLRKNSVTDCIPMVRFSTDEGETWSEPITCITDKQGYFVLNNARVIQLKDGRLMMAVALHQTPNGTWKDEASLYAYYSDDNGRTWVCSSGVDNPHNVVTQEPGLIELRNGQIMMYIRASGGVQQLSYSSDRGQTWSAAMSSNIHSPLSPATIVRIPKTGDLLLVWNNTDGRPAGVNGRTPLTAAISKDEGRTWIHVKNIESDPDGWYCYIAVRFVDNDVLLAYCAGSQSARTHLNVTEVKKIKLSWFYDDSTL